MHLVMGELDIAAGGRPAPQVLLRDLNDDPVLLDAVRERTLPGGGEILGAELSARRGGKDRKTCSNGPKTEDGFSHQLNFLSVPNRLSNPGGDEIGFRSFLTRARL